MPAENTVFELDPGEEVCCVHCRDGTTYRRGGAYLAGPGHTPYNANANYVCRDHLDADAMVFDTHASQKREG